MSFWDTLTSFAKMAMTNVAPALKLEQELSPVISLIPGAAPVVAEVNAGIASIEAVAPGVAASTGNVIADAEQMFAAAAPVLTAADDFIYSTFHVHIIPGTGILLVPKVTAATVPAAAVPAPGKALT